MCRTSRASWALPMKKNPTGWPLPTTRATCTGTTTAPVSPRGPNLLPLGSDMARTRPLRQHAPSMKVVIRRLGHRTRRFVAMPSSATKRSTTMKVQPTTQAVTTMVHGQGMSRRGALIPKRTLSPARTTQLRPLRRTPQGTILPVVLMKRRTAPQTKVRVGGTTVAQVRTTMGPGSTLAATRMGTTGTLRPAAMLGLTATVTMQVIHQAIQPKAKAVLRVRRERLKRMGRNLPLLPAAPAGRQKRILARRRRRIARRLPKQGPRRIHLRARQSWGIVRWRCGRVSSRTLPVPVWTWMHQWRKSKKHVRSRLRRGYSKPSTTATWKPSKWL
mmetsp:Transcript_3737/g.13812  ORF Transcript_3737/g.13812 Transcript_3737/m.13812 type:complete len:330 (+) Transcript_3737:3664-4653(+)